MPSTRAITARWVTRTFVRPWLSAGTLADRRRKFDSLAPRRLPAGLGLEPGKLGNVPALWVTPRGANPEQVVYFVHGGAFFACSPKTHSLIAGNMAHAAGARAVLIDYRLAPEHPFPVPLEDTIEGYLALLASGVRPENVIVAGDSAGGALILGLLLALRDRGEPLPSAGVCISPATNIVEQSGSFTSRARQEALLTPAMCLDAAQMYVGDSPAIAPYLSPLRAELADLPPLLIHVGTHELLYDDSVEFAERARSAGVDVTLRVWDGMWHVFHGFQGLPEVNQANTEIGEFMKKHFGVRHRLRTAATRAASS